MAWAHATMAVLMLFQTKFVLAILMRKAVGWPPQQRGDHQTGFTEAALAHGGTLVLSNRTEGGLRATLTLPHTST